MRHAAHEAARNFLDGFAEDIVNTNEADFENRLEEWTAQGFPELAFYRGDRPRDRGEIIAEIRKAQRALDGDTRALAQATRDELPVLAGALRVAARTLTETPDGQTVNVADTNNGLPLPIYRVPPVLPSLSSDEPPAAKSILPVKPRPKPVPPQRRHFSPPVLDFHPGTEQPKPADTPIQTDRYSPPFRMTSPVPDPVVRNDEKGKGPFWSNRERKKDGVRIVYDHRGIDIEQAPGKPVRATVGGYVTRIRNVYSADDDEKKHLQTIWVRNGDGREVGMFYVSPTDANGRELIKEGDFIKPGQIIGTMQDRAIFSPGMTNHLHMEVWDKPKKEGGRPIDPSVWVRGWQSENTREGRSFGR